MEVVSAPDEESGGIAYRLALPRPRHGDLKSFRVFVIDTHPLIPTDNAVRSSLDRLSEQLAKVGVKVGHMQGQLRIFLREPKEEVCLAVGETYSVRPGRPHLVTNSGEIEATLFVLQGVGEYDFVALSSVQAD